MNKLDKQYTDLLQTILDYGVDKKDRTGTGTKSIFGYTIRHNMKDGFPLLTTKKMYMKGVITELLWFLRGDTNIKYLVDNDCHIWDGDCYKNYLNKCLDKKWMKENVLFDGSSNHHLYLQEEFIDKIKTDDEFAKKWGNLGPIYGKQWRSWNCLDKDAFLNTDNIEDPLIGGRGLFFKEYEIDQLAKAIEDLKTNPDSRRIIVSAWNVGEMGQMTLPPCHNFFQFYTRELSLKERVYNPDWGLIVKTGKTFHMQPENSTIDNGINRAIFNACEFHNIPTRAISLMWNQRSCDTFLGLPFNIASYGLLLEIIAKEVNMVPDELIGNLGDTHLYSNHVEQAREQIGRALSIEERIDLASKKYDNFDIMDFGIPFTCTHEDIDKFYPVERRTREPFPLPTLNIKLHFNNEPSFVPEQWLIDDFELIGYKAHPTIKAPLSN